MRRFDPDTVHNGDVNSSMYWVHFAIFCRLGLVMDEMSLEV